MNHQSDRARLVVRRGQEFYLHLSLSRDYDPSIDGISIVFILDEIQKPQYGHGTLVATALLNPGEISEAAWQTTIDAIEHNFLRIKASPKNLDITLQLFYLFFDVIPFIIIIIFIKENRLREHVSSF